MAISAGSALLSAVGTGFTAGGLVTAGSMFIGGTMLSHFLVSTAIGAAINALTPKPTTPGAQGYTVTTRGSNLDHQIIYGQERVAGAVAADFLSGEGGSEGTRFLHRVQVMAGHEVESYEEVYVNSYKVAEWKANTAAGAGAVTGITDLTPWLNDPFAVLVPTKLVEVASDGTETVVEDYDFDEYNSLAMQFWTGADDQTASTKLIASIPDNKWTSDHRLRGLAYMYVRMGRSFDGDNFPTGVPEITAVIKGRKVYDPREVSHDPDDKSTWEWSDNPALCIRDYLTQDFGLGEKDIQVDDDLVSTAADVCEQSALDGSPFYTCNGAFTTGIQPYDFLNSILSSMGGLLWYAQGQWRMKPAYWTPPTESFNEDDLRSSINVSTRHSRRDNFNTVQGSFRGPETNYSTTTFPAVTQAAFLTADGGIESSIDLEMPFTNTSAEARRIARIILERNRQQLTVSASFGLNAFRVQVGDVINLSLARFGWVNKTFEVTNWGFGTVNEYDIQVELTLREVTENVFDEVDDGVTFEGDNANVPSPIAGLAVTNLTATPSGFLNGDGTFVGKILVSWDAIVNSNVSEYIVEWGRAAFNFADYGGEVTSLGGSPTARETFIFNGYNNILGRNPDQEGFDFYNTGGGSSLTQTEFEQNLNNSPEARAISGSVRVDGATNEHTISPAVDDSMYSIRVKAVNDFGTSSKWATVTINTGKDDTIPSAPTGVSAIGYFQSSVVSWTPPTTNTDGSPFADLSKFNVYRSLSNSFSTSSLAGSSQTPSFKDGGLEDNTTYYYWITTEDYSGNESVESSSASSTTNFISAADMVDDIREEIGAARIDVVSSLPSGAGFEVGDFVYLTTDGKLYEWNGSSWIPVVGEIPFESITETEISDDAISTPKLQANSIVSSKILAGEIKTVNIDANAITAGKIETGAVSADKIAVNDLAAINANLGTVTAGSISTLSGGVGIQVNVSTKPNAVYISQNSNPIYGLFVENLYDPIISEGAGGAALFTSLGGFTVEINNTENNSSTDDAAVFAQNSGGSSGSGGAVWLGESGLDGGYGVNVLRGGYYDTSGDGYLPFTGSHEAMILKTEVLSQGDIVCDHAVIAKSISDSFTEVVKSAQPNTPSAVGVYKGTRSSGWEGIAAFVDKETTSENSLVPATNSDREKVHRDRIKAYNLDWTVYEDDYTPIFINSVGEGAVNVCGEGGDISKGDLIVTSSTPGKGMRQSDDIVRSYTVAKSREDVTFSDPTEVKMVACIYLCG